ncbi:hypothetical protein [Carboxylicivirga sp. N1Y90]|uniref:hypothetical protein n=1 Tax=Carboxylicivirga fragile TaxID=3417571 RepID=UPI003D3270A5|nr:hypothetical protein [Marinilabiliaceae bacterium N1Y90]
MKAYILLLLAFSIFSTSIIAQEEDPFKKMNEAYEAKLNKMHADYAKKQKKMMEAYDARMKKMNAAFERYLKKGFEEVEQEEVEIKPVEIPKPVDQPKFEPVVDNSVPEDNTIATAPPAVKPDVVLQETTALSIAPILRTPEEALAHKETLNIDFFGSPATLSIDKRMKNLSLKSVKPNEFANYWDDFTQTYYQLYIESLVAYAEDKNLNDWGVYQLVNTSAKKLFKSANNQEIWSWAILNQAGYQVKIGYTGNTLCILLPFMQEVYEKPYYSIEGINYYILNKSVGQKNIYTYTENFGGATKQIDLHLPFSLNFSDSDNTVTRTTTLPEETEAIELKMDKTIMAFLASYPQTDNSVYLNAAMSGLVKEDLYQRLKPHLNGKSDTEAVSYLLNYLHNSFEYKTDRDQFNKEKMFFPDELFYYPYSDCEDRTVLFTKLVNDLLGLDVVALTYFSHMAAAVSFSTPVEGYSVMVDGRKYTITDPTYINAPIGSVMPEYEKYTPIAIKINNDSRLNNIWQMIARSIEKDNEGKLFITERQMAENGKYMVSGWYTDQITIDSQTYDAYGGTRDLWFATFDGGGNLEWFLPVRCSDLGYTQAFNVGKKGNVYALINYSGSVNINRQSIARSEESAHLVLGISNNAHAFLNENIDFKAPEGKKLAFYGKYKADGTKIDLLSFPTDKIKFDSKITIDSNNEVVVRGIVGEIEGLTKDVPITLSSASFSAEDQIESYMKDYQSQAFDNHMVALFSTLKLLSQNGGRMSGLTVRNLLNKNNPEFYKRNPKLYEGLLRMQFVVNNSGIIKIETYKGDKIALASMNINNNSNIQITKENNESYQVKFLNGVQVGKAFMWYDLNSISLNGKTGKMVFDYDSDHTQKTVAISDIID